MLKDMTIRKNKSFAMTRCISLSLLLTLCVACTSESEDKIDLTGSWICTLRGPVHDVGVTVSRVYGENGVLSSEALLQTTISSEDSGFRPASLELETTFIADWSVSGDLLTLGPIQKQDIRWALVDYEKMSGNLDRFLGYFPDTFYDRAEVILLSPRELILKIGIDGSSSVLIEHCKRHEPDRSESATD